MDWIFWTENVKSRPNGRLETFACGRLRVDEGCLDDENSLWAVAEADKVTDVDVLDTLQPKLHIGGRRFEDRWR